jgi:hypothetical protein
MLAAFLLSMAFAVPQGRPVRSLSRTGVASCSGSITRPASRRPRRRPGGVSGARAGGADESVLGIPLYPGLQFIASCDAGRDQRYFPDRPARSSIWWRKYRTLLKQKGELVYDVPATHEFDVGRFDETMAFPPGVTIKDFLSELSKGFPNPKPGGQPARFPTIVQIVPVAK